MGGSTTQSASFMPAGQSGGMPAGPRFGMGQFGGYGGGLGGYGGGGYGGFPQTGSGKGFQPMPSAPPPRPQAQYAPMQFLPPQFAQPRFMYPSVAGQMAGQRPVALPQQRYQQPSPAYPFPPVSGGGKGFQGGPRQPMPPGFRPLPIAPPSPGGGPQPFMPTTNIGGGAAMLMGDGQARASVMPTDYGIEGEKRPMVEGGYQPTGVSHTGMMERGAQQFGIQPVQTPPVGTSEPARIQPRETIQPVFDETELP